MRQRLSTIIDFDSCLCIFLFVAPILWLPGITQNGLQFILFNFGGLVLFSLAMFFGNQRKTKNPVPLLLISLSIILSLTINPKAYPVGFISLTAGILFYYAIVLGVKNPRKILWTLAIVGLVNIIFSLAQRFGFYLVYDTSMVVNQSIRISHLSMPGLMGRNYHLSYFLIFLAPLCFILNKPMGWIASFFALLFSVLIESWACKLALGAASIVLLSYMIPKKYLFILLILVFGTLFLVKGDRIKGKISVRTDSYHYVMNESLVNIFKGSGLGVFDINTRVYDKDSILESSFNQYLRLIYEMGLVPFLVIILSMFYYFKKFGSKNKYFIASIAAILTYPMFHEVLRFARFDILIITVIALFEVSCIDRQNKMNREVRCEN